MTWQFVRLAVDTNRLEPSSSILPTPTGPLPVAVRRGRVESYKC
ncbi:hypothetical protein V1280_009267 [Bradyrhizobium sp. AZCC 2230]